MKKLLLTLVSLLCLCSFGQAAQVTLYETTANLGGLFGNDFKLTSYENWANQNLMNTELYDTKADADNISFLAASLADLKILTTAEPVNGEQLITPTPSDKTKQAYTAEQVDTLVGGGFTFDTFPLYEDSAHVSGIARNATTLAVYDAGSSKWLTASLTDSLDPTPVPPTATAFVIAADGETVTATLSESCVSTGADSGAWTLDCTETGPLDLGEPTGLPGTDLTWTAVGGPVLSDVTDTECLVYYTVGANVIEDGDGDDLAGWATGVSVSNGSTQTGGVTYLVYDDFSGVGTPAGWTIEDIYGGAFNFDNTANQFTDTGEYLSVDSVANESVKEAKRSHDALTTVYGVVLVKFRSLPSNTVDMPIGNGATVLASVRVKTIGSIEVTNTGGASATSSSDLVTVGEELYIKYRYVAGTGSNATITAWTSTDGSVWTQAATSINGTSTAEANRLTISGLYNGTVGYDVRYLYIDDEDINL